MWKDLFKYSINEVRGVMDKRADIELTKHIVNKGCRGVKQVTTSTINSLKNRESRKIIGIVGLGLSIGLIASSYIKGE